MCEDDHGTSAGDGTRNELARRALFVTGAAAALTLGSVTFSHGTPAAAAAGGSDGTETRTVRGTLPTGSPDFVYLPVEIPEGVRELRVSYSYDRPSVPAGTAGNALDIGVFDQRGTELGGKGFRGWSGGARTEFFVRADDATPGYIPGRVKAGTWHIALGPYTVSPQGLSYEITITLTYGEPGDAVDPVYPPERAKGRGRAWYRGDCHLHTWYSDGRRTPAEIAALARAAGLDFINSSDHNTHSSHAHWASEAGDDLLIMVGEEVTTRNGHVVALGTEPGTFVDWRYRARDNRFGKYARQIRRAGGLVVPTTRTPPVSAATGSSASPRRTRWRCGTAPTRPRTRWRSRTGMACWWRPCGRVPRAGAGGFRPWATATPTATPTRWASRRRWSWPTT